MESQITIRLDSEALHDFRVECLRRRTTPTKEVARLVAQQRAEWLAENHHPPVPSNAEGQE